VPEARATQQTTREWKTAAALPPHVGDAEIDVYVNGVRQEEGRDYRREGGRLLFARPLAREGRLGFWRWASMFLGIAGTYRQNDAIDVIYEAGGRRQVVSGLPLREAEGAPERLRPAESGTPPQ
jgi:hypothetical protein